MKVIIADDSVLILDRLQDMLGQFRHAEVIGTCKNGTETLAALRNLKPDLAIVDIKMPELTGLEVLNEIRLENKALKIIILTFYSSIYFRQLAMAYGADYFFSKVDDFEKVSEVVAELLMREEMDYPTKFADA